MIACKRNIQHRPPCKNTPGPSVRHHTFTIYVREGIRSITFRIVVERFHGIPLPSVA